MSARTSRAPRANGHAPFVNVAPNPASTGQGPRATSWQARACAALIARIVRRDHWGEPDVLARRVRRALGVPVWHQWICSFGVRVQRSEAPVRGEWVIPNEPRAPGVILYLHGGGYVSGSPGTDRPAIAALARLTRRRVFALDYRLAPEHPFPAALDDAFAAHRWLIETGHAPGSIALAGTSAGGGLGLSTLVRLRDESPGNAPACAVLLSPLADLTAAGTSIQRNNGRDPVFRPTNILELARAYVGTGCASDPRASPVFANLSGLPPVLLHVGSAELLLDDAGRVHQAIERAGGASTLHVFEGLFHGWQMFDGFVPEARASLVEAAGFINTSLDPGGAAP